jgi:hypothetical protein
MAFACSICQNQIQVGEPLLADEKMNLAHESCVRKETGVPREPAILTPTLGGRIVPTRRLNIRVRDGSLIVQHLKSNGGGAIVATTIMSGPADRTFVDLLAPDDDKLIDLGTWCDAKDSPRVSLAPGVLSPAPKPPPPPEPEILCSVCEKPCISFCPSCKKPVHSGYGLSGTCGLEHETGCQGAREAREVTVSTKGVEKIIPKRDYLDKKSTKQGRRKKAKARR